MGGDDPEYSISFSHNFFPVKDSIAIIFLSGVPVAIIISPPVDNSPPKFISPLVIVPIFNFLSPKGTSQFYFPVFNEKEVILPCGGLDAKFPYLSSNNCQRPSFR